MAEDRSFLARWSERKQAARQEPAPAPEPPAASAEAPAPGTEGKGTAPPPELPDIETLDADSDYRPFLAANVPLELRQQALRKLWRSDPRLANLDGLVDHGEDYTDAARVLPGLKTAYRVGRGLLDATRPAADEPPAEAAAAVPAPATEAEPQEPAPEAAIAEERTATAGDEGASDKESGDVERPAARDSKVS